jgi:hypothetical protein
MPSVEIVEFAKLLVQHVRDGAISSSRRCADSDARHIVARRWRAAVKNGADLPEIATVLVPDIVDNAVFHLLNAIDGGDLRISFTASNGRTIDLMAEGRGELAGWYMGSGGWRALYSKERYIDDFSDLI